jgi:hypothetical protein
MLEAMMASILDMIAKGKPLTERQQRIYNAYKEAMSGSRK